MEITVLQCPSCGASLQWATTQTSGFCQFCGAPIQINKPAASTIQVNINAGVSDKVKIDNSEQIENYLIRAYQFKNAGDLDSADYYYNKILDLDPTNKEAISGHEAISKIVTDPNVFISRGNARGSGEAKTVLFIDGKKQSANLDSGVEATLQLGEHVLKFQRAAATGNCKITVTSRHDRFNVVFTPKLFTINTNVKKKR